MVSYLRRKQQPTVPQAMKDFFAQQKNVKKKSQDQEANLVRQVCMNNEAAITGRLKSRRNGEVIATYESPSDNDENAAESFILRSTSKLRDHVVTDQLPKARENEDDKSGIVIGDFESYAPDNHENFE